MDIFSRRYRQSGTPLAHVAGAARNANFDEWQLRLHPDVLAAMADPTQCQELKYALDVHELRNTNL